MIKGIKVGYWMTYTTVLLRNADILVLKTSVSGYPATRGHNSLNVRFGARKRKGRTLSFGTYIIAYMQTGCGPLGLHRSRYFRAAVIFVQSVWLWTRQYHIEGVLVYRDRYNSRRM